MMHSERITYLQELLLQQPTVNRAGRRLASIAMKSTTSFLPVLVSS